jgi:hypothetical protein
VSLTTLAVTMSTRCSHRPCGASHALPAIVDAYTCGDCGRTEPLPPDWWRDALAAAVHELPRMTAGAELTQRFERTGLWAYVETCKELPTCSGCRTRISIAAVERGRTEGSCGCEKCGARVAMRPVPPALVAALPGITHLLAEGSVPAPDPDDEDADVAVAGTPFLYLVHDAVAPRSGFRADIHWGGLVRATMDRDGNLYALGEDREAVFDRRIVFSLDSAGRTRWVRREPERLEDEDDDPADELASRSDGTLVLWSSSRASAMLLRAGDGGDAGRFGAKQAPNSAAHGMDLTGARSLAFDTDGSVIFIKERRIVRCGSDGTAAPIWPPHKGFLGLWTSVAGTPPFTGEAEEGADAVEDLGAVASFDRAGRKRWQATLPRSARAVAGDSSGNAYALTDAGEGTGIVRVAPDGTQTRLTSGETELRIPDRAMLVKPDGTILVFGQGRKLVTVDANGGVRELLS